MCCLFGMIDYGHSFSGKQKSKMLSALARECEERGTDASGIAYNYNNKLRIYKRPLPARQMKFHIPNGVSVVMGHTRLATQGNAKRNYNNHPFLGRTADGFFSLCHNGVLYNDTALRKTMSLPQTRIETDSYVAVQLIEKQSTLDLNSLKYMAETVEGSFCFTAMDERDNLYFVKGDNPLCIYHYRRLGLILYASTEAILSRGIARMKVVLGKASKVEVNCGEILKIDAYGKMSHGTFNADSLFFPAYYPGGFRCYYPSSASRSASFEDAYLDELRTAARYYGFDGQWVDSWYQEGLTLGEIEELLYTGEI